MNSIKEDIKKEFQSKKLSHEQLQTLMKIQKRPKSKKKWVFSMVGVAACAILIFINSLNYNLPAKVATEIAYNHLKNLPSEHMVSDYPAINNHLTRLEFAVRNSSRLSDYELVGARYCSIQGKTAAQIKLKSPTGKIATLYQYQIDSDFDQTGLELSSDGVEIKLWSEEGLHFGLAEEAL